MVYCDTSIEFKNRLNTGGSGGVFKALGRSMVSNQSMFLTEGTSTAHGSTIALGASQPGEIFELPVDSNQQWLINDGCFLAHGDGVGYHIARQRGKNAWFGAGGFFVMETEGQGSMLITSCGTLHKITLDGTKPITIDNTHIVAWSNNLAYETHRLKGTWEWMTCTFSGVGDIYLQTSCRFMNAIQNA